MENRWNEAAAQAAVEKYKLQGVNEELALRVYTSRLIGGDPALVLHGGGNTSLKGRGTDALGVEVDVLYVKGSGWDLASIEPAGLPAVKLAPLQALQGVAQMTDEQMVNALRINLLDASAQNPSVEALLHAFLPYKFVDHTHADAVLSLVDQPDPEKICADVFGDALAVLPFHFPGFPLAGIALKEFQKNENVEGIVLINHGLFTFGESAEESYNRMIHYVSLAEKALAAKPPQIFAPRTPLPVVDESILRQALPVVRGALNNSDDSSPRFVLHTRTSEAIRAFSAGADLADYACRGVVTPDHIIRTKNLPLILPVFKAGPAGQAEKAEAEKTFQEEVTTRLEAYQADYHNYFQKNAKAMAHPPKELDALPRIFLLPGWGIIAAGKTEKEARIAADLYEHTVEVITQAERYGCYTPLPPKELFAMEYWSLEQAKLGKGSAKPLTGQVALITGAGSGIGAATALAFAEAGAHLALVDLSAQGIAQTAEQVKKLGVSSLEVVADVTKEKEVKQAFDQVVLAYGGLDIAVSNAGKVFQGEMADLDEKTFRESFELNFFSHQFIAAQATRIFRAQGTGGVLLFNASKSAFNPGPNLGPYTLPKTAVIALMKQYAVEYGPIGVRANAVNADRVPTAIFGEGVLEQRAKSRGLTVESYLSGNLMGQMVRPQDVAQAFLHLALSERTTGATLPVDGGNIAASPR